MILVPPKSSKEEHYFFKMEARRIGHPAFRGTGAVLAYKRNQGD
jgi:hypothetical protein